MELVGDTAKFDRSRLSAAVSAETACVSSEAADNFFCSFSDSESNRSRYSLQDAYDFSTFNAFNTERGSQNMWDAEELSISINRRYSVESLYSQFNPKAKAKAMKHVGRKKLYMPKSRAERKQASNMNGIVPKPVDREIPKDEVTWAEKFMLRRLQSIYEKGNDTPSGWGADQMVEAPGKVGVPIPNLNSLNFDDTKELGRNVRKLRMVPNQAPECEKEKEKEGEKEKGKDNDKNMTSPSPIQEEPLNYLAHPPPALERDPSLAHFLEQSHLDEIVSVDNRQSHHYSEQHEQQQHRQQEQAQDWRSIVVSGRSPQTPGCGAPIGSPPVGAVLPPIRLPPPKPRGDTWAPSAPALDLTKVLTSSMTNAILPPIINNATFTTNATTTTTTGVSHRKPTWVPKLNLNDVSKREPPATPPMTAVTERGPTSSGVAAWAKRDRDRDPPSEKSPSIYTAPVSARMSSEKPPNYNAWFPKLHIDNFQTPKNKGGPTPRSARYNQNQNQTWSGKAPPQMTPRQLGPSTATTTTPRVKASGWGGRVGRAAAPRETISLRGSQMGTPRKESGLSVLESPRGSQIATPRVCGGASVATPRCGGASIATPRAGGSSDQLMTPRAGDALTTPRGLATMRQLPTPSRAGAAACPPPPPSHSRFHMPSANRQPSFTVCSNQSVNSARAACYPVYEGHATTEPTTRRRQEAVFAPAKEASKNDGGGAVVTPNDSYVQPKKESFYYPQSKKTNQQRRSTFDGFNHHSLGAHTHFQAIPPNPAKGTLRELAKQDATVSSKKPQEKGSRKGEWVRVQRKEDKEI